MLKGYYYSLLLIILGYYKIECFQTTEIRNGNSIFIYSGQARSEKDLLSCTKYAICSIVHKRFWFPQQVERFCRCDGVGDCSSKYSDTPNNYTMQLDNRSQFKFCDSIGELPNCLENRTLLSVEYKMEQNDLKILSESTCNCPANTTWKTHEHRFNDYLNGTKYSAYTHRCSELDQCVADEFCGFVRADHFSTYYRCSCPTGHICIHTEKDLRDVTLPFFEGKAYKANCTKIPDMIPSVTKQTADTK